jgi:hypothetical protein
MLHIQTIIMSFIWLPKQYKLVTLFTSAYLWQGNPKGHTCYGIQIPLSPRPNNLDTATCPYFLSSLSNLKKCIIKTTYLSRSVSCYSTNAGILNKNRLHHLGCRAKIQEEWAWLTENKSCLKAFTWEDNTTSANGWKQTSIILTFPNHT